MIMLEENENLTNLYELTITDFAQELGSSSPAPGGGSTAALSGALACSLINMVGKITLKRSEDPDKNIKLKKMVDESEEDQKQFLSLVNDDTAAFNKILQSFKLPKDSEHEKQSRTEAIQAATKHAAEVPLSTARLAWKALERAGSMIDIGSENAVTDTGVAGLMAYSSLKGAVWNVKINLGSIKDPGFVQETNLELEQLMEKINHFWPEFLKNVEGKLL
jgi:formiminotetrahydrofolate cyclodeaminase